VNIVLNINCLVYYNDARDCKGKVNLTAMNADHSDLSNAVLKKNAAQNTGIFTTDMQFSYTDFPDSVKTQCWNN